MEIIREEEITKKLRKNFRDKSKNYLNEKDNKSLSKRTTVRTAIVLTSKLTPNQQQQPILVSSNIVKNTHINNQINFDNDIFNNESLLFQQSNNTNLQMTESHLKRGNKENNLNNLALAANDDSTVTQAYTFDYQMPKRAVPNQKASSTFKSVVNSLIAERLLNYSKEYDFSNEDKNSAGNGSNYNQLLTTNGFGQSDNSNFSNSSLTNSRVFTNDGSSLSSSSLNLNVNSSQIKKTAKLTRNKATSFPQTASKLAAHRTPIKPVTTASSEKFKQETKSNVNNTSNAANSGHLNEQSSKREIKFKAIAESVLLNVKNDDIKNHLLSRSKTMNATAALRKPVITPGSKVTQMVVDSPTSSSSSIKPTTPIIRPITSTAVRNRNSIGSERKTGSSTLIRRQAMKKKNNEDQLLTNKETITDKIDDNDDACSYTSVSDIFVKSRSSENFNLKNTQQEHQQQNLLKSEGVNEKKVIKNSQKQNLSQEPPIAISFRETPQYRGRWTDLAVNYYLDHQEDDNEDDNDSNNKYNNRYQNFTSDGMEDYNYVSSIFKIRRYNLSDSSELEKAKKDLFKRYSFINDPYIKSRLTNLSSLSDKISLNIRSNMRSNMSTTSNSRLSVTTCNDRKY